MAKPPGSEGAHVLQYHAADDDDVADAEGVSPQRGGGGGNFGGHADVLRVLLSALSLQAVVREYRNVLARTLLSQNPDIDAASEVLERMKCIFGEEALGQCVVMLRDITISRRTNAWMDDRWRADRALAPPAPSRLAILSGTCWPTALVKRPPRGEGFEPHPTVQQAMDAMTKTFRLMKPSQTLVYHQSHGVVTLRFDQRDPRGATVSTEERLPPAVASAVLFMEEGLTTAGDVAERMKCTPAFLVAQLQPFAPRLIVVAGSGAAAKVGVQHVQVAAAGCFAEAEEADSNQAPSFLSPEELQVFEKMSSAMLKTGGPKTAAQIENSIRMFGKFRGTAAQAKEVLLFLVAQNKISTPDAGATFCAVKQ
jgi:anaphase-promoting complex subunit 2